MVARIARLRERTVGDFNEDRANAELERTNDALTTTKNRIRKTRDSSEQKSLLARAHRLCRQGSIWKGLQASDAQT